MSTGTVYRLKVKSMSGEWMDIGPGYSLYGYFLFEKVMTDELEDAWDKALDDLASF